MASSVCRACRLSSKRVASSPWRVYATSRGLRTTALRNEAHNFNMPALSPTMTEGTISSWKIKEGDSFSAGDVILEIETDKASMDVEAQDDGILAKITVQAGKSPVKVGSRIAVLAEPDDDIKSLEIPAEDSTGQPQQSQSSESTSATQPKKEDRETHDSASKDTPESKESTVSTPKEHGRSGKKVDYIPSPGITHLLHLNKLNQSDVKGTGPNGRVLKGDILAHIGKIDKSAPKLLADDLAKLSKLDLSNVKPAKQSLPPKKSDEAAAKKAEEAKEEEEGPIELEIQTAVSMARVINVQRKFERTFRTQRSWSSFVNRAVMEANMGLPPSRYKPKPTPDALFDEILGGSGSTAVSKMGPYLVADFRTMEALPELVPVAVNEADVIDVLTGAAPATRPARLSQTPAFDGGVAAAAGGREPLYMLSVVVPPEDEHRGSEFLSRVKSALEEYPEKLLEE